MIIEEQLADELEISINKVNVVIKLLNEGNTVPFIARYRKEMTGNMDDITLRKFEERYNYLLSFKEREKTIIKSLSEQGVLSDELKNKIDNAKTLSELEDLYLPYRPKRKTRAIIAKSKGLLPIAETIIKQIKVNDFDNYVLSFIGEEDNKAHSVEEVLQGAKDIIAEQVSEDADARKILRKNIFFNAFIKTEKIKDNHVFEMYYDYKELVKRIPSHRILAINRGEKEGVLKVKIICDDERNIFFLKGKYIHYTTYREIIEDALKDAYNRLIFPSLENELRNELTLKAEDGALNVFKANLQELLMEAPIKDKIILGFDPAFRTGCKLACIDAHSNVLSTGVIYPTAPQNKKEEAKKVILDWIKRYKIDLVSLGNGTASRESEAFLKDVLEGTSVDYVITDESGASVYSASELGSKEFPNYDVALRSAVSMARRIQDPLCELVKIPPKSMGVGQYQHDMNQKRLEETLTNVVVDCVNAVGVNLNTASKSLLSYISGISDSLADNILQYKKENGIFKSREELKKVKKLGAKTFEQCAGFLRIEDGINPLDNTTIHPENYDKVKQILDYLNLSVFDLGSAKLSECLNNLELDSLAKKFDIGELTLNDILQEMQKPGRDIRDLTKKVILRHDVTDIKELSVGMVLEGTVRNIMDFGVFVDIGVHQDGLIHISELSKTRIKHPLDVVSLHQIVKVKVIGVDVEKRRISLSLKQVD